MEYLPDGSIKGWISGSGALPPRRPAPSSTQPSPLAHPAKQTVFNGTNRHMYAITNICPTSHSTARGAYCDPSAPATISVFPVFCVSALIDFRVSGRSPTIKIADMRVYGIAEIQIYSFIGRMPFTCSSCSPWHRSTQVGSSRFPYLYFYCFRCLCFTIYTEIHDSVFIVLRFTVYRVLAISVFLLILGQIQSEASVEGGQRMGHTIALANQKGGVSKTTTTLNLGYALALNGRRVLLIDLDPQASLTMGLGVGVEDPSESLFGVIEAGDDIHGVILSLADDDSVSADESVDADSAGAVRADSAEPEAAWPNGESATSPQTAWGSALNVRMAEGGGCVHLAPSHISMSALDSRLKEEMGYHAFLSESLESIKDEYDFILIDCRPALDALETNAMYAADYLIIPVETHKYSLYSTKDLGDFYQKIRSRLNPNLTILGVLFTRVEGRTRLSQEVIGLVTGVFGDSIFDTQIRKNVRLAEVPDAGDSIFDYAPKSHGAEDYMKLAQEVIQRVG